MPASRSKTIFEKSSQAMIAAVEIYNKPDFEYRAETFSILAVNAWELLLKARIVALNQNKINSIFRRERKKRKDGSKSSREYIKKNRSGIPRTIGIDNAIGLLNKTCQQKIPVAVQDNLEGLTEIRNNAIHLKNDNTTLVGEIHEIASAAVINYTILARQWFNFDWSRVNIYLLPISFVHDRGDSSGLSRGNAEESLSRFLKGIDTTVEEFSGEELSTRVKITVSLQYDEENGEVAVRHTATPSAVRMELKEEDLSKKFPWSYADLLKQLRNCFPGFKQNSKFYDIKRSLEKDGRYCHARPNNLRSLKGKSTKLYSPTILEEFQKVYGELDCPAAGTVEELGNG